MIRVAVISLSVGKSELHRLDHRMHEVGPDRIECRDILPFSMRQALQHDRSLTPRAGLGDGPAMIVIASAALRSGLPLGHIVPGQDTLAPAPCSVHRLGLAHKAIDSLGDEALRPTHRALSICASRPSTFSASVRIRA